MFKKSFLGFYPNTSCISISKKDTDICPCLFYSLPANPKSLRLGIDARGVTQELECVMYDFTNPEGDFGREVKWTLDCLLYQEILREQGHLQIDDGDFILVATEIEVQALSRLPVPSLKYKVVSSIGIGLCFVPYL